MKRRRRGLMSNYFNQLLAILAPQLKTNQLHNHSKYAERSATLARNV